MDDAASGISVERHGPRGRYLMPLADGGRAELTFVQTAADHMIIDHSWVPPKHRGRGVALKLVARAVADARATGFRITPACGYVAAEFRHHPEWADVLRD
jgi:predicted GNAT family acetyltransferase